MTLERVISTVGVSDSEVMSILPEKVRNFLFETIDI